MRRSWFVAWTAFLAWDVLLCSGLTWAQSSENDRLLILDVTVNGKHLNKTQEVGRSADGRWSLPAARWIELRWPAPQIVVPEGTLAGHAWLDQIEGLQMAFDPEQQSLTIVAPASAFATHRKTSADDVVKAVDAVEIGAYANYELQSRHSHGNTNWSGSVEMVGFGPGVRLTGSAYYRDHDLGQGRWVRLETGVEFADESSMHSLRLGDQVTSSGQWGRPARIGGVGLGTRFAMQPSFVPFAMPSIRGEALLPSTIEVLVNNNLVTSGQVPSGPFEWNQLPVVTGQGELRLEVTDLMGRKTEIVHPYLVSDQLLRSGLADYSIEVGRIREDYGYASGRYGRHVLLGQYRRGISDRLTTEFRLERLTEQRTTGVGLVWTVGDWGVMQATTAASVRHGKDGYAGSFGLDVPGSRVSLQVRSSRSSRFFAQLGADSPESVRQSSDRVGVLLPWSHGGIGMTWGNSRYWNAHSQRFWSLTVSASLSQRLFLSAYFQSAHLESRQRSIGINLVIPLEQQTQAWVHASRSPGQRLAGVGWMSSLAPGPSWAHRLYMETDKRLSAQVERRDTLVDWQANVDIKDGVTFVGSNVSGSVVLLGGRLRPARRIDGSFALVKVGDIPGIPVYRDQHQVGRTESDGTIVINDLRPYQSNLIHVDANDIPMDSDFERLRLKVSPSLGAGVYVDLGVTHVQPLTLRLLGPDGQEVAPGTVVRVHGRASERSVGYDGKLFEPDWTTNMVYTGWVSGRLCQFRVAGAQPLGTRDELVSIRCEEVMQ